MEHTCTVLQPLVTVAMATLLSPQLIMHGMHPCSEDCVTDQLWCCYLHNGLLFFLKFFLFTTVVYACPLDSGFSIKEHCYLCIYMWWILYLLLRIFLHMRINNYFVFGQWYECCYCFTELFLVKLGADLNGSPSESCRPHTRGNIVDTGTETCSLAIRWHMSSAFII